MDSATVGASSRVGPARGVAATSISPPASAQHTPGWRPSATTWPTSRDVVPCWCSTWTSARPMPVANHVRYAGSHSPGEPATCGSRRGASTSQEMLVSAMATRTTPTRRPRSRRPTATSIRAGSTR
ncbi:hypothetical protein ASG94_16595 [Nocardioides sp. Soil805]|nr:hypothetical protein ASG94_16595 [Nocardioides sp. Soil805]